MSWFRPLGLKRESIQSDETDEVMKLWYIQLGNLLSEILSDFRIYDEVMKLWYILLGNLLSEILSDFRIYMYIHVCVCDV